MKKLTDVYIKVTKANVKELRTIIQPNLDIDDIVAFNSDCLNSFFYGISIGNRKKVSLAELKRLIDTIPTREEIKRLKQQISGYKTSVERIKNSSEPTNVLNTNLTTENNNLRRINKELSKEIEILLKEDNYKIVGFQTNLELTIERCKELQSDNESLVQSLRQSNNINIILKKENEQLKQRKWYKFWK